MLNAKYIAALLLVCIFMFLFGLGNMALTDPDETFYAQTAKEMLSADDWITPTIFGQPQFEKPVFYYWLIGLSYKVFGVSEFSARLPSALFAVMGIFGIYFLGRLIFSPLTGFLSALIMATCVQYVILARAAVTDMVLLVCILFCLLFFLLGITKERKGWYFLSAITAALAVLTKGPIGLFIPGTIIMLYFIVDGRWKKLRTVPIFWSFVMFLIVCLPWYVMVAKIHGGTFISEFFGFQNVTRFLEPEHRIGSSPLFYVPVILGGIYPWTLFFMFGAWVLCAREKVTSRVGSHKFFLICWFLVVFVFFSVSRTKLVTYIFPLFPVMAIVTGRFWERALSPDKPGEDRVSKLFDIAYLAFVIFSLVGLAGIYLFVRYKYPSMAGAVLVSGSFFFTGVMLSIFFFFREKKLLCFLSIVLASILLILPVNKLVSPIISEFESSKGLAGRLKGMASSSDPIGGEDDHRRGIAFYTDRTDIVDIHPYNSLVEFASRKNRVWGIIQDKHYRQLKEEKKDLYMESVAGEGKYVIMTNKPYTTVGKAQGKEDTI